VSNPLALPHGPIDGCFSLVIRYRLAASSAFISIGIVPVKMQSASLEAVR